MTELSLPAGVAAALDRPAAGHALTVPAAGIPFGALAWGAPEGRPLLLIHGVTSSAATWWRVGPALAATGRRVVAVDLPGHGRTGQWTGEHRFRATAGDIAAFVAAAGLDVEDLQVVGHSWGAMVAAALPASGIRPATIVLLDPPAVPLGVFVEMAASPESRHYDDLDEARQAVMAVNPGWSEGDVLAKAQALTQLDDAAARAVLLENGDWDGGLADLGDPAAHGLSVWIVRGEPALGGLTPDDVVPRFADRIGTDHILTIAGAEHSPQRLLPAATTAALLRALDD
jgi:pimeloyl-ACP methyl ester carboxylesterase